MTGRQRHLSPVASGDGVVCGRWLTSRLRALSLMEWQEIAVMVMVVVLTLWLHWGYAVVTCR